jgi:hypothetical protein
LSILKPSSPGSRPLLGGLPLLHAPARNSLPTPRTHSVFAARWVHLPSGRVYNTTYSAPKVPGRDDITGEPLSKRPDDTPVSRLRPLCGPAPRWACWHSRWLVQETFSKRLQAYYESTAPLLQVSGTCDGIRRLIIIVTTHAPRLTMDPRPPGNFRVLVPHSSSFLLIHSSPSASPTARHLLPFPSRGPLVGGGTLPHHSLSSHRLFSPEPRCFLVVLRPCWELAPFRPRPRPRPRCLLAHSLLAPLSPRPRCPLVPLRPQCPLVPLRPR